MITNILYPTVYNRFPDYVDIELVPFGNAKIKVRYFIATEREHFPHRCQSIFS